MSPSEQRGQTFVRANCSTCHATDKVSASPLKIAPPFRELHLRYPVESLQEALVEGIRTGHANMPEFRLDAGQASDVIAFSKPWNVDPVKHAAANAFASKRETKQ